MAKENSIKLFQKKAIRSKWDDDNEKWYFSVVDIVAILTDSNDPKQYIKRLRTRDEELNAKWGTICTPLEMPANDGKIRKIQATDTAGALRIIQSIPSKKAEPFKMWLAQVGKERIDEIADPELSIDRAMAMYRKKGYSDSWINQRIKSMEVRKNLTDEWNRTGITEDCEYAILTNEITKAWSGKSIKEYKNLKNLKKENLRDNMTNLELILNMLAEVTTTELSRSENPDTFSKSKNIAQRGGSIAGETRKNIEKEIKKSVVSPLNAKSISELSEDNKK